MPIKVTKASDQIDVGPLCLTLYSNPGLGKTSLAFTAQNPILFDFERGVKRADNRGDHVTVEDWRDIAEVTKADLESYDTIIIDTVGKALECLTQDILRRQSRLGYGGALNQQGWGQLAIQFRAFVAKLRNMGKDIIFIAHMDEVKNGEGIQERLKIPGSTQGLVLADSDSIARISIQDGRRYLIFNPTEASFGKDPARIGASPLPDSSDEKYSGYLARCLEHIRTKMGDAPADKGELEWFTNHLPECKDAEAINALKSRAHKAGRHIESLVKERAEQLGLEYDPTSASWVYLEEIPLDPPIPDGAQNEALAQYQ